MPSPRSKAKSVRPAAGSPVEQEREYRMLALALEDAEGFALILATYDDPRRRDELIDRLSAEERAHRLLVTRLDLSGSARGVVLLKALRQHLAATDVPEGWRHAVMVVDLESLLDYRRIGPDPDALVVLQDANFQRDAFPVVCPVPVVLWLSPIATSVFAQAAPDLWHWRVATFDFTTGPTRRFEVLSEAMQDRPLEQDEASRARLEQRAALLRELVLEAERDGGGSPGQRARLANLLGDLAWTCILLGRPDDAVGCATRQLDIARGAGDRRGEGAALGSLGNAYADLGEPRRAIELHEQALAIRREIGDRRGEGSALGNLGNAYFAVGEPRRAIELHEQALAIAREVGDRQGEGQTLNNLGIAYAALGEPRRAIELHEQALAIARKVGDRRGEGRALGNLGNAYRTLGELPRAVELYEQVLAVMREVGDRRSEGQTLNNLGIAYAALGEPRRAIELHEQALAIARKVGDRRGEGQALGNLGNAYRTLGELPRAVELYEQVLAVAREIGDRRSEANALFSSGLILDKRGDREAAKLRVQAALAIYEQIEDPWSHRARAQLAEWEDERA